MRLCFAFFALALPLGAGAVSLDWVTVGSPGNPGDPQPQGSFGAVAYAYQISRTETTNAQYAEFLNAVADADPNALYNPQMNADPEVGGIARSGSPGSYSYTVKPGFAQKPVAYTSFVDAQRFVNWLHNGQPTGAQGPAPRRRAPTR